MRLNGSLVYSATLSVHQEQIFLGLPPWCSGLRGSDPKSYALQVGGGARIQSYGPGLNPTQAQKSKG